MSASTPKAKRFEVLASRRSPILANLFRKDSPGPTLVSDEHVATAWQGSQRCPPRLAQCPANISNRLNVAATRVLRRSAPELLPALVAPGVASLASSACDKAGAILHAAGGRFSASLWGRSREIDLGSTLASPEEIAVRWQRIVESQLSQHEGCAKRQYYRRKPKQREVRSRSNVSV
jgi:hypothetical protein